MTVNPRCASHTALVGIRATQGLTSRDGIVPLSATRDVGVNTVIERAVELIQVQGRLRNVEMRIDLESNLPEVRADPYQLEQVLVNLLLNATDALEDMDGDRWISVGTGTTTVTARDRWGSVRRRRDDLCQFF